MILVVTQLKKKLAGGHKKKFFFVICFFFIFNTYAHSSQILDYETELYIESIISKIKLSNNINRDINFKIISDSNINAFVNENNVISIAAGLIENSPDYVALLSVIAHEIGHIEKNHVAIRKSSISRLKEYRNISNLSIIAGSMISGNPELLQSIAISEASMSNLYLSFSKEQEIEADYYALETLNKMELNPKSIIELLEIIESKALEKGLTEEKQRYSTHPYFRDRIDFVNYLNKNNNNFDLEEEKKFKFIKAKFIGYRSNLNKINQLSFPYGDYSKAIYEAKKGNLNNSLKKLNKLIKKYKNNYFLIETKADILYSYGYTKESIEFYKLVLKKYPANFYAQIRIFGNIKFENLSENESNKLFDINFNLLERYYNNKNILLMYYKLSNKSSKKEWVEFLYFWMNKNINDIENIKKNLAIYSSSNDIKLAKLTKLILRDYK